MSDEVKSHKTRVPRSIIVAAVANSIMMFAFAIVMLYCLGDLDTVLGDTTGLPLIQVFYLATKSKAGATIMVVLPAIVLFVCIFNAFASVSRLTWAFARDRGLPFSDFFSYVSLAGILRIF
jgi:amino acid transporter